MKAAAEVIGVSRSNLIGRLQERPKKRLGRPPLPDDELVAQIKAVIAELPTYGYRRVHAILKRKALGAGIKPPNHKRLYRVMKARGLLLDRHVGGVERRHDGRIAVDERNRRWCSDGFEIGCDNGEKVRVAFALDCCDREAMSFRATTCGIRGEDVRDLMVAAVEHRFGRVNRLPVTIEWLSVQLPVQYRLNYWNRDFFNAFERKNGMELWAQALIFIPLAAASLTLAIVSVWGRMTMQRKWRAWLSIHLYDYWLETGHYRRLQFMSGEHQNPEYRIAEDARIATDLPIDLTLGLLSSSLTAIIFIGVLWNVGGGLVINAFGLNLAIPGYLVIAVVLYSALLTAAMMIIAQHLTRVVQENKRAEPS